MRVLSCNLISLLGFTNQSPCDVYFGYFFIRGSHSINFHNSYITILIGYRLDSQVSIPSRGKRFSTSPHSTDKLWGKLNTRMNGET
jgi:hypothetical protein